MIQRRHFLSKSIAWVAVMLAKSIFADGLISGEGGQMKVSGESLHLFDLGEDPAKIGILRNRDTIRKIELTVNTVWAVAEGTKAPEGLATASHLEFKLPDGRHVTLLAGSLCCIGKEWRKSEEFQEVEWLILRGLARDEGFRWHKGAVNTRFPTEEEKKAIIKRIVENTR